MLRTELEPSNFLPTSAAANLGVMACPAQKVNNLNLQSRSTIQVFPLALILALRLTVIHARFQFCTYHECYRKQYLNRLYLPFHQ